MMVHVPACLQLYSEIGVSAGLKTVLVARQTPKATGWTGTSINHGKTSAADEQIAATHLPLLLLIDFIFPGHGNSTL
jgi:hypothetical protein